MRYKLAALQQRQNTNTAPTQIKFDTETTETYLFQETEASEGQMDHDMIATKRSQDSISSASNGPSISTISNGTDVAQVSYSPSLSSVEEDTIIVGKGPKDIVDERPSTPNVPINATHTIKLSSIEHCMPRAYIRVCFAYRLPDDIDLNMTIDKLNKFVRRLVDSKPYLAGNVVAASETGGRSNVAEIQFTVDDYVDYPDVQVRRLSRHEIPLDYDGLNSQHLPPSFIRPELVSALPEDTDDDRAPVFRVQANLVDGGLIVSVYLHHCISDGKGLGSLVTGQVLKDAFTFKRHLEAEGHRTRGLPRRLAKFCEHMNWVRQNLSFASGNEIVDRHINCKKISQLSRVVTAPKPRGCGCIFAFSKSKLTQLKVGLDKEIPKVFTTPHDSLLALLWQHMTIARQPSIDSSVRTTNLFIPVDIRNKFDKPLTDSYFGAAVDFARAHMSLSHMEAYVAESPAGLAETAIAIRRAIEKVKEPYIRQLIALANEPDPDIDMRDTMGANMNRSTGADMYITSWEKLGLYDADFDMGLGQPDWVRKPWSKDPGSCVVLPHDERKSYLEVLIQMSEDDMLRLLDDELFMSYVVRVVDRPKKAEAAE